MIGHKTELGNMTEWTECDKKQRTLWRAAHLCGQLPVLLTNETSSSIVDTFVPCDPNMYSHLCTEIYLSLFTALD